MKTYSSGALEFLNEPDQDGQPRISETYNRLGSKALGEILLFCHDDIEFIEDGWDAKIIEFFAETDFDVAGVVGVDKYEGGLLVQSGHPHCFGKFVNRAGDDLRVNIYGPRVSKKMAAVDGMFMAVRRSYFDAHKFDENLNGLFFYDIDYCLGANVGIVDLMVAHYKPADRFGKYPKDMRPMSDFEPYFYAKHGISPVSRIGDTRALCASQEDYVREGHEALWGLFADKYLLAKEA